MKFRWIFPLLAWLIAGCDQSPPQGPAEIRWDRDTCERCRMLISDRQFAAQYRDAKTKVHLFDDLGEMILAIQTIDPQLKPVTAYVSDIETGLWLEAGQAYYSSGHITPMGFGYGAHESPLADRVDFRTVAQWIAQGKKGAPTPHQAHDAQTANPPHSPVDGSMPAHGHH
ncbi:MAG: protein NosL [Magnetococcales bacterium]|nr:protein NosL [Magnetococcales bacterium]